MIRNLFLILFLSASLFASSQPGTYGVSNAHSHNDYEQPTPFWMAYNAGFGSMEADIFLVDSILYVAHDRGELRRNMKLESAYLIPLISCLQKNGGRPFSDSSKKLQMLIDIKTGSVNTLNALISLLKKYPALLRCKSLTWVVTGNRPADSLFSRYPGFIRFDGELNKNYSNEALSKISMMSDDFRKYSAWNGKDNLPEKDDSILILAVRKSHELNKPVRFWDAPDNANAWQKFMLLQIDYINTDHIDSLARFLNK